MKVNYGFRFGLSGKPSWSALHEVANGQSGYFTVFQAATAGFSPQLLHRHVHGSGRLERPLRGVYRISHLPPADNEDLVILWLWSDRKAIFSHETALGLYELSDALAAKIHLTLPPSSSGRKVPEGVVARYADLFKGDWQWIGSVPVTTPARAVREVAVAHGDAQLVAQAIDQGIRQNLFDFTDVAVAGRYVFDALTSASWTYDAGASGKVDDDEPAHGVERDFRFYARPFVGVCSSPPPPDWARYAADLGHAVGARLRVARYSPSRRMFIEFAWPAGQLPQERQATALRNRLARRFAWT